MSSDDGSSLVRIGALELRFLLDETQGSGDLVVFEFLVPPGARVPEPHYHRRVDEFVYGLGGVLTSIVNGTTHEVRAGDKLFIPRGAMHHHSNQSDTPANALVTLNPGTIGKRYFQEIGAAVAGPGRPDPAVIADIMARYDLFVE